MITLHEIQTTYQQLNRGNQQGWEQFKTMLRQYVNQNSHMEIEELADLLTSAFLQTRIQQYREDGNYHLSQEEIEKRVKEEMTEEIEDARRQTARRRNRMS